MSSHLVLNGVDEAEKARLESYWAKKLPRLQKLLAPFRTDLREIRLTVGHHQQDSHRSWYEGRAVIPLPTGTLAANAENEDPLVVLDRVAAALATEIKRHKERVRRDYISRRKDRDRAGLSAAGPLLQRSVEDGRWEDFFRLLRPHLRSLRDHARRELRRLEQDGTIHRREVTVDDLLDEVLAQAWQRYGNRPRHLSLDLWLIDLLDKVLERWIKQEPRPHASLEAKADEVVPEEVPPADDEEWWVDFLGDEETLTLGDLIPAAEGTDAWDQLEADEQRDRLLSLISELPPARRQAFLLSALEDYPTDEIAGLQGRPESEVKKDIELARQTLRDRLLAGGYLQAAGEPATVSSIAGETAGT